MTSVLEDVLTAVTNIKASRDTLQAETTKASAVISGPATGEDSTVNLGDDAGVVDTLARTLMKSAGRVGLNYTFNSTTDTTVSPGAGKIAFNHATLSSVTEIVIAAADANGLSHAEIATYDDSTTVLNRGRLHVQKADGSAFINLQITGAVTAISGAYRIPVAYKSHSGSFTAIDEIAALFVPTGDRGGNNYTFGGYFPGDATPAGGEALIEWYFETNVTFATNMPGSNISSRVAAPEDVVYTLWRMTGVNDEVGTQVGTATIAEGEKVATFLSSEFTMLAGQFLQVRHPDPPVSGLESVNITLTGTQDVE